MFADLPYGTVVAMAIALIPAVVQWITGRAIARAIDDPALPERLAARQRRGGAIFGFALALLIVLWGSSWYWTIPLALVARLVAAYPLRRALYAETWSLAGYLSYSARAVFAFFGFWIVLAWMPALAGMGGRIAGLFALAIAGLLLLWNAKFGRVIRFLLRARPIEDATLVARFNALADGSGLPPLHFEYFDLRGGAVANAVALPGIRRSAVVFTDTLLGMLDHDEAVAICAHEIAHLEHYNPRRLRRLNLVAWTLIALGVATVPAGRAIDSTSVQLAWTGTIVLTLALRARFRQRHETESDLRAVALTGNPEALISGLVKLHTFARIPRRWDAKRERLSTHPSLARRIRDIRAAAAIAPAPLGPAPAFTSGDGGRILVFTDRALQVVEKHNTTILDYAGLTELRLDAGRGARVRLVAVQRGGKRWEIPVAAADLGGMQSALDLADAHLAEPDGLSRHWPRPARLLAAMAALAALTAGQFAMIVVAVLTAIEQSPPFLAAAGVAALTSGLLALRTSLPAAAASRTGLAALLAALGSALVWMAWGMRTEVKPRRMRELGALLAVGAASAWAILLSDGLDLVELHHHARAWPAAVVFSLAVAAALAFRPGLAARSAAAAAGLAGLLAAAAGSIAFLDRFGHDGLLVPAAGIAMRTITDAPALTFDVPFDVSGVVLSPAGRHVALMSESTRPNSDDEITTFHVGPAGGPLSAIDAEDLVFADEGHVVLLDHRDGGARLREVTVDGAPAVVWQQEVRAVVASALSVDPTTGRWRLLGWDDDSRFVHVEGTVGTSDIDRKGWPFPAIADGWPMAVAASRRGPLVVEVNYRVSTWRRALGPFRALLGDEPRSTVSVRRADGSKIIDGSRMRTQCVDETAPSGRILCSVFDGSRSRLVSLDADGEGATPVGSLDGRFFSHRRVIDGWISGWLDATPVAVRLGGPEAVRVVPDRSAWINELAANDAAFATVIANGDTSTIRLYPQRR